MAGLKIDLRDTVSRAVGTRVNEVRRRRVASLWAGYGEVERLELQYASQRTASQAATSLEGALATPPTTLVMKTVSPPVSVISSDRVGHERKIRSYQVEAEFYRHHAPGLIAAGLRLPVPILIDTQPPSRFTFILSDLAQGTFQPSRGNLSMAQLQTGLQWLAHLHARYHGDSLPTDLWPVGGFWHLQTRQDELNSMPAEWADLKSLAPALDTYLRGLQTHVSANESTVQPGTNKAQQGSSTSSLPPLPRHTTILHGDFKSENLMFGVADDGSLACAAYDFQYCGAGYGARDVVYLFCSSTTDRLLSTSGEEMLLKHYHTALLSELRKLGKDVDADAYSFDLMMEHFEVSLLDYVRFMAGWGWWGATGWAQRRAKALLPIWSKRLA